MRKHRSFFIIQRFHVTLFWDRSWATPRPILYHEGPEDHEGDKRPSLTSYPDIKQPVFTHPLNVFIFVAFVLFVVK